MICSVFLCKQKTAYEMRISDWSSDVCSSDLVGPGLGVGAAPVDHRSAAVADHRAEVGAGTVVHTQDERMVLEVLADAGQVVHGVDARLAQSHGVADS